MPCDEGSGEDALNEPRLVQAVVEHPVVQPAIAFGNVIVATHWLLPPVVLDALWPINQLQRVFPVKLAVVLA